MAIWWQATCCTSTRSRNRSSRNRRNTRGRRAAGTARRYSGQGDRRAILCSGHALARHGACPRGASAELRRPIDGMRHDVDRNHARCHQGCSQRQFSGRGTWKEFAGDQGHAGADGGCEMEGDRRLAEAGEILRVFSCSLPIRRIRPSSSAAIRRRSDKKPSKRRIPGPISHTARSARPARWLNWSTTP